MEYWKYKEITENYYRINIQQLHKQKKKNTDRNLITLLNPLNYLSNSLSDSDDTIESIRVPI